MHNNELWIEIMEWQRIHLYSLNENKWGFNLHKPTEEKQQEVGIKAISEPMKLTGGW